MSCPFSRGLSYLRFHEQVIYTAFPKWASASFPECKMQPTYNNIISFIISAKAYRPPFSLARLPSSNSKTTFQRTTTTIHIGSSSSCILNDGDINISSIRAAVTTAAALPAAAADVPLSRSSSQSTPWLRCRTSTFAQRLPRPWCSQQWRWDIVVCIGLRNYRTM